MAEPDLDITEDRLLGGAVTLLQPRRGHRVGTDAVLLAGLAEVRPGDFVADLGAATGTIGLMLAVREPTARILLVERDPELVALAVRNLSLNGLEARGTAIAADVFGSKAQRDAAGLPAGQVDLVVTNPPFFEGAGRPSPEARRRSAHEMSGGGLSEWLDSAADLLRHRGRLALIHRSDHLGHCLAALARRFGSVAITPIYPRAGEVASRIVITAVKGGRAPMRIASPLDLHQVDGRFTESAARLHGVPT